jgi:hypothetical protein
MSPQRTFGDWQHNNFRVELLQERGTIKAGAAATLVTHNKRYRYRNITPLLAQNWGCSKVLVGAAQNSADFKVAKNDCYKWGCCRTAGGAAALPRHPQQSLHFILVRIWGYCRLLPGDLAGALAGSGCVLRERLL